MELLTVVSENVKAVVWRWCSPQHDDNVVEYGCYGSGY